MGFALNSWSVMTGTAIMRNVFLIGAWQRERKDHMAKQPSEAIKLTPEQLRRIQLVELDILLELDRVCRKHQIDYFLCGGTALGAVRHSGFIPWDNDVDVGFLREDYERFCRIFPQEADASKYFLQTWKSDPHYLWNYGKIRRLGTEYVRAGQERMKYRTGISIDVFPYDYLPIGEELHREILANAYKVPLKYHMFGYRLPKKMWRSRAMRPLVNQARMCTFCRKATYSKVGRYQAESFHLRMGYWLLSLLPGRKMAALLERTARKYNDITVYGGRGIRQFAYASDWKYPSLGWNSDKLLERKEIQFEGFSLWTVKDTDWYLSSEYGTRYMELPPPELRYGVAPASKIDFGSVFEEMEWCTEKYFEMKEGSG